MKIQTTVSLTVRTDLGHKTILPGVRLRLGDQTSEHRFTEDNEHHKLTVTSELDAGDRWVSLEYMDDHDQQGGVEVLSMFLQGDPIGMKMYQCEYTQWSTGETKKSHTYMDKPGIWRINVGTHGGSVGFV